MERHVTHRGLVAETLVRTIQRADELSEFVAIYWGDGRRPLSAQVKKGLAAAFLRFDEYALAKYDRAGAVRLRDVLFLSHAKPMTSDQSLVWRRLIAGELTTPDTWEVALSSGGNKRAHWERLLIDHRLGSLALLCNLRNMKDAGVAEDLVLSALPAMRIDRVLPFRFLAAARHAPRSGKRLSSAQCFVRLKGPSSSPDTRSSSSTCPAAWSRRSQMLRTDAAYGLAVLLRELAEKVTVYTFSNVAKRIAPRRGFALRDATESSQPHQATYLGAALDAVDEPYDRIAAPRGKGYVINVASARDGVGYGPGCTSTASAKPSSPTSAS